MLDPPLVLKLSTTGSKSIHERLICVVTLLTTQDISLGSITKQNSSQPSLILFGETCTRGHLLKDFEDPSSQSLYFIFADLSVRVKGEFKIACHLLDMNNIDNVYTPLVTESFLVYPPKQFPGMLASTDLTKHLFNQGVRFIRRREYKFASKNIYLILAQPNQEQDDNIDENGSSTTIVRRNSTTYTPSE